MTSRSDTAPESSCAASHPRDAFATVLGSGRGVTDARALTEQLLRTERELVATHGEVRRLRNENDTFAQNVRVLDQAVGELDATVASLSRQLTASQYDRFLGRYLVVRAGSRDPLLRVAEDEHHGIYTPGRPYLGGQHVYAPRTGACYCMLPGGVPPGQRPSDNPRWHRCDGGACPRPRQVTPRPHQAASGHAVRQSSHWWDASGRRWELCELSPEHLLAVIAWLRDLASHMRGSELARRLSHVPCPAHAYPTASLWLADTPLMRALLAERRRRGLQQPRRAPRWRWGDEHPF